jgi:hypothetical protein
MPTITAGATKVIPASKQNPSKTLKAKEMPARTTLEIKYEIQNPLIVVTARLLDMLNWQPSNEPFTATAHYAFS